MTAARPLLLLCFYASGAAALIAQVVWARMLAPLLGATLPAVALVLAAFMGGLALGGWWGGRRVDGRPERAVLWYALLESGTALGTLALPFAFQALARVAWDPRPLVFALILIPTTLMGATLPVLARALTHDLESLGSRMSELYAANTTGAMIGSLAAGYLLIPGLGLTGSLRVAAAGNVFAALVCVWLGWRRGPLTSTSAPSSPPTAVLLETPWRGVAVALFGLCGLLGMAFEVAWTRALIVLLGNSVYAFSAMLFVFLAGLAVGGLLIGAVCDRLDRPQRALAWVVAGVGLAGLVGCEILANLAPLLQIGTRFFTGFGGYQLLQVVIAALVLLPQAVLLGCAFPLVCRLVVGSVDGLGRAVGTAYLANTLGGVAGSLLAGFWLVPGLGARGAILALSGTALLVGAFWLVRTAGWRSLAVLGLPLIPLALTSTTWNPRLLLRGFDTAAGLRNGAAELRNDHWQPIYHREGRYATVLVAEGKGQLSLSVNGQLQASSLPDDRFTQEVLGHLPMLFAPAGKSVLVIGMGTGMTAAAVARHQPEQLHLAELEPAVLEAGPLFQEWNAPLWSARGFRPHLTDGRLFVARGGERFDVITSDPIHPLESAASSLYTEEHFRNCRERLSEGGVMCQWLPLYGLSPDDARRAVGAFTSVFPQASLWCYFPLHGKGDAFLIATRDGTPLPTAELEEGMARLRDQGVTTWGNPAQLLGGFVMGGKRLREFASGLSHTDDRPTLEFSAPRSAYLSTRQKHLEELREVIAAGGDDLPDALELQGRWLEPTATAFSVLGREAKAWRLRSLRPVEKKVEAEGKR